MKKYLLMALAVAMMTACEKDAATNTSGKVITFNVRGEGFGSPAFTRAIDITESDMTDLWVFDYLDGELFRTIAQRSGDDDFGSVSVALEYGEHSLYFVASRGAEPSIDDENHIISWSIPRDTYWQEVTVNVTSGVAGVQDVTMKRVATRLRLTVNDEVPEGLSKIEIKPATWYCGLDWQTGLAEDGKAYTTEVSVPSSYIGTSSSLVVSIYGISDPYEWTTAVEVTAKNGSGGVVGHATISAAPFKANRISEYSGRLFSSSTQAGVSLDNEWDESYVGTW